MTDATGESAFIDWLTPGVKGIGGASLLREALVELDATLGEVQFVQSRPDSRPGLRKIVENRKDLLTLSDELITGVEEFDDRRRRERRHRCRSTKPFDLVSI